MYGLAKNMMGMCKVISQPKVCVDMGIICA